MAKEELKKINLEQMRGHVSDEENEVLSKV